MILDALILNTDRHHENWALIRNIDARGVVVHTIASTFDHASSLGRNEPPEKLAAWLAEPWRPRWYANRSLCRGGIYLRSTDTHGANPLKLLELVVRKWPKYVVPWLPNLEHATEEAICDTVNRIPSETMVQEHRDFSKALLRVTYKQVKEILS